MSPYYNPTKPGYYPLEDFHAQAYWKVRALELEMQEEEDHARQCAYEEQKALEEYYSLGHMDSQQEWYSHQHLA